MDRRDTGQDAAFRHRVREWLHDNLSGDFSSVRGLGGPGREDEGFDERLAWDRHLARSGWSCLGWPLEHGGQGLSFRQQVIFHEEYARADAPTRVNHLGEELLGPTLIAFGSAEQRRRFLPPIAAVEELWCQGYSEPGAGSDLASVRTAATRDGDSYRVSGQKVWTSLAQVADWCFALVRTDPNSGRHAGLSYLLIPMRQPGVEVRPIQQLTGTSEFNEVFFDGARTEAGCLVGEEGEGWRVAMGTLQFERGVSTIGQQVGFRRELEEIVELARRGGGIEEPAIRERLTRAWIGLEVMHAHAMRTLASPAEEQPAGTPSVAKLVWATWHQRLGELAMDVAGAPALTVDAPPYDLDRWQRLFLFSRADTIYGGSDEIQRNVIAERVLGLPREARP